MGDAPLPSVFPQQMLAGSLPATEAVLAFIVPLAIITTSYLLLLAFLQRPQRCRPQQWQDSRMVACSVCILVASFVICWFPNHVVTLWGILMIDLVPWDSYFLRNPHLWTSHHHLLGSQQQQPQPCALLSPLAGALAGSCQLL